MKDSFLWFPKTLPVRHVDGPVETRWLERARWIEDRGCRYDQWYASYWLDAATVVDLTKPAT